MARKKTPRKRKASPKVGDKSRYTSRTGRVYELTLVADKSETEEKPDKKRGRATTGKKQMELFG